MDKLKLFSTGFLQVFFVSANTYFLSKEQYLGVSVASFMISFIWAHNVKKVAFGSGWDKAIYALGANAGALLGLFVSKNIMNNL